jgi:hypothetical protein
VELIGEALMTDQRDHKVAFYDQMTRLDRLIDFMAYLTIVSTTLLLYAVWGCVTASISAVALVVLMVIWRAKHNRIDRRRQIEK